MAGMWEGVRYQAYEAKDGHVLFMASEQLFWKNFCQAMDRMDLFEKWPGSKYADHARGNKELQTELREIFKTKTVREWIAFGDEHNTTLAPFNTQSSIADDPQFQARMGFMSQDDLGCDQLPLPVFVNGEKPPVPSMAPTLGQHTDEVMAEVLGKDPATIKKLREDGAFG
jgi:crotonobetainyl-CoA:carnitine CoA-transferase CaiB-like acyl-CoA transferase